MSLSRETIDILIVAMANRQAGEELANAIDNGLPLSEETLKILIVALADGPAARGLANAIENGVVVPTGIGQGGFNSGTGANNTVRTVTELVGGGFQLIFTGAFTTYAGATKNRIVKVTSNAGVGSIDAAYHANNGSGFNGNVQMSAQDTVSGKLYAVGDFTSFNGTLRDRLLRLNVDGSLDTTFV